MDESAVTEYITQTFSEVETTTHFGYTFFIKVHARLAKSRLIQRAPEPPSCRSCASVFDGWRSGQWRLMKSPSFGGRPAVGR
jgi:hypothetical protein